MPARLTKGVIRPACPNPEHVGGRTWLGGFYARHGYHERPRWWCAPPPSGPGGAPAWKRHRFIEPLRRRHGSAELGKRCEMCDHEPSYHEGPETGRGFTFTINEVARALVSAGEGLTYRTTSHKARRRARPQHGAPDAWSDHPQLVMNYLDAFGDEIYARCAETEWPAVLIGRRATAAREGQHGQRRPEEGRQARLFRSWPPTATAMARASCGGWGCMASEDAYEWERFLRTMPGEVRWLVCDRAGAIAQAARAVWPGVVIYNCEWHISQSGLRWVRPTQLGARYPEMVELVKACTQGQPELDALGAALATLPEIPPALERWDERQRRKLPELWAKRRPDMPRGSGPLEERLDRLNTMLGERRRFRFRNLGRLEHLLGLMRLELNRIADERDYAETIRDHLVAHGGSVRSAVGRWRRLADPRRSGSSVRELTKQAEERIAREKALAEQRKINRQIERAWRAKQRRRAGHRPAQAA